MLSKRLDKLIDLLPECNVLADVGCDHGYAGIGALQRGKASRVVFIDVSLPSLNKARDNCPVELRERCDFLCRDGLGSLQADCALIAGMGGLEIVSICSQAENLPHYLVLQPNRNVRDVREYLTRGYEIVYDGMMCDSGKFYNMIVAESCAQPTELTESELEFGKTNLAQPSADFRLYLDIEQAKLNKIYCDCHDPQVKSRLELVLRAQTLIGGKL